jgi:hypothetical protein
MYLLGADFPDLNAKRLNDKMTKGKMAKWRNDEMTRI